MKEPAAPSFSLFAALLVPSSAKCLKQGIGKLEPHGTFELRMSAGMPLAIGALLKLRTRHRRGPYLDAELPLRVWWRPTPEVCIRPVPLDTRGLTLVITDKPDVERDAVADVWSDAGGEVLRLGRFWDPPALDPKCVRVYGADSYCQVLAQKLGLVLVSPQDDLLLHLAPTLTKRALRGTTLGEAAILPFPAFIKTFVPKLIRSRIYESASDFRGRCKGCFRIPCSRPRP